MDLKQLVDKIKEERVVIAMPLRQRRKPVGRNQSCARWRRTEKGRLYRNSVKRASRASLTGAYVEAGCSRRMAGQEWNMTREEWIELWRQAGKIVTPLGLSIWAHKLRGRGKDRCQLRRIDTTKAWDIENTIVLYKGRAVGNGKAVYKEMYGSNDSRRAAGDEQAGSYIKADENPLPEEV